MPTYDYNCLACRKRFDVFMTYQEYGVKPVHCAHCGSADVQRRVNRIRVLKGDDARLESLADPDKLAGIEDDPRAMAKMFREMGSSLGEEMPPQFNEIVDRLDAGQSPQEIESNMPDWGGEGGATSFGSDHHDHSHDHSHEHHSHSDE